MRLWTTAVKRSRADWPVVLASWALLTAALGLLAAGVLYTEAVTLAGLHRELRSTPAADRSVVVRTQIRTDRLEAADAAILPLLSETLALTGGELVRIGVTTPFADAAVAADAVTDLVVLAAYEGIERHAGLSDGRWATGGADPVEVTLSDGAAAALGVRVGDTLDLTGRVTGTDLRAVVTGTWTPDPDDPYWLEDALVLDGEDQGGSFRTLGPLMVAPDDLRSGRLASTVAAEWRAIPDVAGFRSDNLDAVAATARAATGRINAALPGSNQASVATRLPAVLAAMDRSLLVAQAGIGLLVIQFAVLGGYAVILVAALLVDRRRTETALLRARGAGTRHLMRLSLAEALLVAIPAVIAAPWLGALMVAAVRLQPALSDIGLAAPLPGAGTLAVVAAGGLIAVLVLVAPTLATGTPIAGVRAAVSRQVGRTLPQRLGLDLAFVALAAIALLQLRQYGAPLTRNGRGVLGVDPLLVAAPAIGLVAGAILAVRIIPRLAELGERVLVRGRGLVPALAGRQLARRPLRYTRAALLLVLAAALGTFASAHAATWEQSQVDQAAFAAGSDVRIESGSGSDVAGWAFGSALRDLDGVTGASPVNRVQLAMGAALRDAPAMAVDARTLRDVVRLRDDAARTTTGTALDLLAAARVEPGGLRLPDGVSAVAVTVDPDLQVLDGFAPVPEGYRGLSAALIVMDGDGRTWRLDSGFGVLGEAPTRLVIPFRDPATGAALTGPVDVLALELEVNTSISGAWADPGDPIGVAGTLAATVDVATDEAATDWQPLDVIGSPLTAWTFRDFGVPTPYAAPDPGRLLVRTTGLVGKGTWRLGIETPERTTVPALAGPVLLERAMAKVGDTLTASVVGVPVDVHIVGALDEFPTLSPDEPFLLVDGAAVELARYAAGVSLAPTGEWWTSTADSAEASIAATVRGAPFRAQEVVSRAATEADLAGDSLGLSVIGILQLGSVAALLFAAIGYLVSATVATGERLGELALLKALGVSSRQLLAWLTAESALLLVIGLGAGVLLGLVLAWLALPFATLTASGEPPVPAPVVVVPAGALVPVAGLAIGLIAVTFLLLRRILPGARTSAVLRASDE